MKLIRKEQFTDTEGDLAQRRIYEDESGKQFVCGPGYHMLPIDLDGRVRVPSADDSLRLVNHVETYRP
jgi:hypothetical protein